MPRIIHALNHSYPNSCRLFVSDEFLPDEWTKVLFLDLILTKTTLATIRTGIMSWTRSPTIHHPRHFLVTPVISSINYETISHKLKCVIIMFFSRAPCLLLPLCFPPSSITYSATVLQFNIHIVPVFFKTSRNINLHKYVASIIDCVVWSDDFFYSIFFKIFSVLLLNYYVQNQL